MNATTAQDTNVDRPSAAVVDGEPEDRSSPDEPPEETNSPQHIATAGVQAANGAGILARVLSVLGLRNGSSLRESLEDSLTREDGTLDAVFDPSERMLLKNILLLREKRIEDVMVPRADIDAIEASSNLARVLEAFRISGHSRMPVYRETLDDPLGMLHIKDLMALLAKSAGEHVKEDDPDDISFEVMSFDFSMPLEKAQIRRPILFVPPSMPVMDLMAKMQATRIQMALVIDEYGGTDGLVSLEDIVETVVGDIEDEHDEDEPVQIAQVGENQWVADGRILLEDLVAEIGNGFEVGEHGEDIDTLGGLLFTLAGRVPVRGELIRSDDINGYEFEVIDADPRRIKRLRIWRTPPNDPAARRRRERVAESTTT